MYAVLRRYTFDPTATDDIRSRIQQGVVPLLRRIPGFAMYYWLDAGDGTGVALSLWDDADAERSAQPTTDFLQQQLEGVLGAPETTTGDVTIHATRGL